MVPRTKGVKADDTDPEIDVTRRPKKKGSKQGNPLGITSYYCGVFALVPFVSLLLGPLAITLGVIALRKANLLPDRPGRYHSLVGIVLGVVGIVGTIVIFVLERLGVLTFDVIYERIGIK